LEREKGEVLVGGKGTARIEGAEKLRNDRKGDSCKGGGQGVQGGREGNGVLSYSGLYF